MYTFAAYISSYSKTTNQSRDFIVDWMAPTTASFTCGFPKESLSIRLF